MKHILALDQGTTSSRAIVFDKRGRILGMAQQEFAQIYPYSGWVEHDPKDILGSQIGVVPEALIRAGVTIDEIEAIGITNQRETTFVWDKNTGKPVANAIVWQCRRTADFCEKLKTEGLSEFIYEKTGLVPDAYFSATKLKWILDNVAGARDSAKRRAFVRHGGHIFDVALEQRRNFRYGLYKRLPHYAFQYPHAGLGRRAA